jgi:hypothetical protein
MALKHHSLAQAKLEIDRTIGRTLGDPETTTAKANKDLKSLLVALRSIQGKINDGSLVTGVEDQIITRLATLQVVKEVITELNDALEGEGTSKITTPDFGPDQTDGADYRYGGEPIGHGLGADHLPIAASVDVQGDIVEGYRVINKREDSVEPDPELDLVLQAYHEMANSLQERLEGTYEDLRELDVHTSKNTPAIKILVRGYVESPHALAAKAQEDAVTENPSGSYPLPIPDKSDAAAFVEGPDDDPELTTRIEGAVSDFAAQVEEDAVTQQYVVDVVSQNVAKEYFDEDEASTQLGAKVEAEVEKFFLDMRSDAPPVFTSRIATGELRPGTDNYMKPSSANPNRFA